LAQREVRPRLSASDGLGSARATALAQREPRPWLSARHAPSAGCGLGPARGMHPGPARGTTSARRQARTRCGARCRPTSPARHGPAPPRGSDRSRDPARQTLQFGGQPLSWRVCPPSCQRSTHQPRGRRPRSAPLARCTRTSRCRAGREWPAPADSGQLLALQQLLRCTTTSIARRTPFSPPPRNSPSPPPSAAPAPAPASAPGARECARRPAIRPGVRDRARCPRVRPVSVIGPGVRQCAQRPPVRPAPAIGLGVHDCAQRARSGPVSAIAPGVRDRAGCPRSGPRPPTPLAPTHSTSARPPAPRVCRAGDGVGWSGPRGWRGVRFSGPGGRW
jgi:hypothetical protein